MSTEVNDRLEDKPAQNNEKQGPRILGLPLALFLLILAVVLAAVYLEVLPGNIVSGMVVAMVLGAALKWVGDSIPIFSTFGGGSLMCIIFPALFIWLGVLPESVGTLTDDFYNEYGFAELVVTGLIVGSILGMDRRLLMKVGVRFFIPLLAGVILALSIGGLVGHLTGFGMAEAMFFVVGPIMGGGMAAGAVPLSEIYASVGGGGDPGDFLARLAPAVMVGNMVCIVIAGLLNGLTKRKRFAFLSGDGKMLRKGDYGTQREQSRPPLSVSSIGIGLTVSIGIYAFGEVVAGIVPVLHPYVWIILAAAIMKIFNLVPASVNQGAEDWYNFISTIWIPAVLVAISAGMIDFEAVLKIVADPAYMGLTVLTVVVATITAGLVGVAVGFYFVESSISAGLGMADMGGSGDVAVLSASERLGLMPFLQIASRLGGAIMLVIMSILAPLML